MSPPSRSRKSAEESASRASALRYRALVEGSRDLFIAVDADLTISWVSPSVESVLGFKPADLVGCILTDLLAPASRPALDDFLANRKDHMVRETLELELRTQTRRTRLVEATVSDIPEGDTAITGDRYVVCCTDVTEWRLLFAFEHWDELTGDLRASALTELEAHWKREERRRAIAEWPERVGNPAGRVAAALTVRRLQRETDGR